MVYTTERQVLIGWQTRFAALFFIISFHASIVGFAFLGLDEQRVNNTVEMHLCGAIIAPPNDKEVQKTQTPINKKVEPKKEQPMQKPQVVASNNAISNDAVVAVAKQQKQPEIKTESQAQTILPITSPIFNAAHLHNPPPVYPKSSRKRSEEGKVFLRVFVEADGSAKKIELKTSSGFEDLDDAAMDVVKGWKFVPAKKGNESISAWVIVPITFKLGA